MFTSLCPRCKWTPRYPNERDGQEVTCPECGTRFTARPVPLVERAVPWWMRVISEVLGLLYALFAP